MSLSRGHNFMSKIRDTPQRVSVFLLKGIPKRVGNLQIKQNIAQLPQEAAAAEASKKAAEATCSSM